MKNKEVVIKEALLLCEKQMDKYVTLLEQEDDTDNKNAYLLAYNYYLDQYGKFDNAKNYRKEDIKHKGLFADAYDFLWIEKMRQEKIL